MKNELIFFGIFLMVTAFGAGVVEDLALSALGVPSLADIGEDTVNQMTTDQEIREMTYPSFNSVRLLENLPFIILAVGIGIMVVGAILPE